MTKLRAQIPFLIVLLSATMTLAADPADPNQTDPDFKIQGEYRGERMTAAGKAKVGVQVIALGDHKFEAVVYGGGLPGNGWDRKTPARFAGKTEAGATSFAFGTEAATISGGKLQLTNTASDSVASLARVERQSLTLGAKPPEGAVVLFDGSSPDNFGKRGGKPAVMTDDGLLTQGAYSKRTFGSHKLHIEFRLPFEPKNRGQDRGNSGLYLQGRFEVQMLDSFGLTGEDNECGGIYKTGKPDQNMCYPPLAWQTYDVDFTAAEYDADDKKTKNAYVTVYHNGVMIHEDLELPSYTAASMLKEAPEGGPIYLQDHSNPVRYRNIWVVEK